MNNIGLLNDSACPSAICFMLLLLSSFYVYEVAIFTSSILQIRKLRLGEVTQIVQEESYFKYRQSDSRACIILRTVQFNEKKTQIPTIN